MRYIWWPWVTCYRFVVEIKWEGHAPSLVSTGGKSEYKYNEQRMAFVNSLGRHARSVTPDSASWSLLEARMNCEAMPIHPTCVPFLPTFFCSKDKLCCMATNIIFLTRVSQILILWENEYRNNLSWMETIGIFPHYYSIHIFETFAIMYPNNGLLFAAKQFKWTICRQENKAMGE